MEVLRMSEEDVDEVWELDKLCFTLPWSRESFADEMKNTLAYYYIIRDDSGILIAYCGFWNVADEGHITNVAVHPDFRCSGYGSILIDKLVETAKKLKLELLTLEVRAGNIPAQHLYKKYGFEILGKRPRYYADNKEDALIMTKTLNKGESEIG